MARLRGRAQRDLLWDAAHLECGRLRERPTLTRRGGGRDRRRKQGDGGRSGRGEEETGGDVQGGRHGAGIESSTAHDRTIGEGWGRRKGRDGGARDVDAVFLRAPGAGVARDPPPGGLAEMETESEEEERERTLGTGTGTAKAGRVLDARYLDRYLVCRWMYTTSMSTAEGHRGVPDRPLFRIARRRSPEPRPYPLVFFILSSPRPLLTLILHLALPLSSIDPGFCHHRSHHPRLQHALVPRWPLIPSHLLSLTSARAAAVHAVEQGWLPPAAMPLLRPPLPPSPPLDPR